MTGLGNTTKRNAPALESVDRLDKMVADLSIQIDRLAERLAPILTPIPAKTRSPHGDGAPARAPLTMRLEASADSVGFASQRVEELASLIEI